MLPAAAPHLLCRSPPVPRSGMPLPVPEKKRLQKNVEIFSIFFKY
jgi:hypothetical protein